MQPRYPLELHGNAFAISRLRRAPSPQALWDRLLPLRLAPHLRARLSQQEQHDRARGFVSVPAHFVYKLAALASTHFQRALFLDNDVRVLQPNLVHTLLSATLGVVDVAMPLDINRDTGARCPPPLLHPSVVS